MNWKWLPGLPGTGESPIHLHCDQPTPCTEGLVLEHTDPSGDRWIANLQRGDGYATKLVEWNSARACIAMADSAVYFVPAVRMQPWHCYDTVGIDCQLTPDEQHAVISTYTDVLLIDKNGELMWRRTLGVDGIELIAVENDFISGRFCWDPPELWTPFCIARGDGTDLSSPY